MNKKNRFTIKIDENEAVLSDFNTDSNKETLATDSNKTSFNILNKKILNLNINDNLNDVKIQPQNFENIQNDKILDFFKEKERNLIENHCDILIQQLLSYMQGANAGLDLSYFW